MNPYSGDTTDIVKEVLKAATDSRILSKIGKGNPSALTHEAGMGHLPPGGTLVLCDASASMSDREFRQLVGPMEGILRAGHTVALWGSSFAKEVHILQATCFGPPPSEPRKVYHQVDLDSDGDVSCPLRRWPLGAELSAHPTLSSPRNCSGGLPPRQASPCTGAHLCATASPPAWAGARTSS